MNQEITKAIPGDSEKLDLILLSLERLEQDLHLAKCEIKTVIRDMSLNQNLFYDLLLKLHANFAEINSRLHGIELQQQRQNSTT